MRGCAINGAVLLAAIGLGFLAAEGIVRLVAPQQLILVRPDIWMPADTVGWLNRPNVHTQVNTGERTVTLITDSEGFRVGNQGRSEASQKVLIMGDSFMEALQVEYEQTLAGLLQGRLPQALGHPVAIRDAGVDGWDPPQYYLRTRTLLGRDHYDLLLVSIYLGNDVVDRWPRYFPPRAPTRRPLRIPRRLSRRELVDAILFPIDDFLKVHSQLFVFLKTRLQTTLMRLGLSAEYFPVEFYKRDASSPRWSLTADICKAIADVAQGHHTRLLFVMVPAPFQADQQQFQQFVRGFHIDSTKVSLDQPDSLLGAELRKRHLPFVSALTYFRRLAGAKAGSLYGHVDRHLTPIGHAALERFLEPEVTRELAAHATAEAR